MRAVAVTPGVQGSARLIDVPAPSAGRSEVRFRVLCVGIDGTDLEIDRGECGEPPPGEDVLIIGHEGFGRVDEVGADVDGFAPGDTVAAMVRRPDDCAACRSGEPDFCIAGRCTERGIKGLHGFLAEQAVESPRWLVKVPVELREAGVLLEPFSAVEKGIRHGWTLQRRMRVWDPRRALVTGAGPVGLLAALLLRIKGLETFVHARAARQDVEGRLAAIGATYIPQTDDRGNVVHLVELPERFGPFDFIFEATGSTRVAAGAMRILGTNGALCLASVAGGEEAMEFCSSCLNRETVLRNKVVFGTVSAGRMDFESGVRDVSEAARRWPGWLERVITRRVPVERFREAFERRPGDLKVVVEI